MSLVKQGIDKQELLEEHQHVLGQPTSTWKFPRESAGSNGLSGSGKSTLIRHINRLIEPTAGEILVGSDDVLKMDKVQLREFRRHRTAMVFQRFALLPHRTVLENVSYGLDIQGIAKAEHTSEQNAGLSEWDWPDTGTTFLPSSLEVCSSELG